MDKNNEVNKDGQDERIEKLAKSQKHLEFN